MVHMEGRAAIEGLEFGHDFGLTHVSEWLKSTHSCGSLRICFPTYRTLVEDSTHICFHFVYCLFAFVQRQVIM